MAKKKEAPKQKPVQTNAGPSPMGQPAQPKPTTVNQGLKIAGTGGITKKELQTISDTTGKSGAQVIQRLDALNQKLKGNDQVGINLNSGAANMLIREATKNPTMDSFYKYGGKPTFGTGRLGKTLEGMLGTRSTGGYQGKDGYIGGASPAVARTILPRGMDLMPSGRQTVRGIGKQFAGMPTAGEGTMMPAAGIATGATGATEASPITAPEMLPELPPEEEKADQMMPGAGSSADLANWATGFKTARSSRKRSGPRAQGLASQRVNPTGAFRGGM
jgi:hypothetical protein